MPEQQIEIETGWTGNEQESSFMNATLQSTPGWALEFSVATHIDLTGMYADWNETNLRAVLDNVLSRAAKDVPEIRFEVKLGPSGDGQE